MMYKNLNERQGIFLQALLLGKDYAISDIAGLFGEKKPSPATLSRDVKDLRDAGFLIQVGDRKSAKYTLSVLGAVYRPINAHEYCSIDVDKRLGSKSYEFELFSNFPKNIFSNEDVDMFDSATEKYEQKSLGASDTIRKKELERFVIELSWKSSKIEGNTYTLLDTELLIKEGIEAKGHPKEEAIMILNHKKAFTYALANRDKYKNVSISQIEDMHRLMVEGLDVSFGLRSRVVGITGSLYYPLGIQSQIREALESLCVAINELQNPYDKALLILLGISYIQPFEDGNKRTARLMANAVLLAYDCAPLSYRNVDEVLYRENILVFYEKNSVFSMRDLFKEQYLFSCENYLK
jgi:fido (protein-threonine AMPylation protein)